MGSLPSSEASPNDPASKLGCARSPRRSAGPSPPDPDPSLVAEPRRQACLGEGHDGCQFGRTQLGRSTLTLADEHLHDAVVAGRGGPTDAVVAVDPDDGTPNLPEAPLATPFFFVVHGWSVVHGASLPWRSDNLL